MDALLFSLSLLYYFVATCGGSPVLWFFSCQPSHRAKPSQRGTMLGLDVCEFGGQVLELLWITVCYRGEAMDLCVCVCVCGGEGGMCVRVYALLV